MSDQLYDLPASDANAEVRHVLSELINAIFDVDKMLYFVAPEWWKPRRHYSQFIGKPPYKTSARSSRATPRSAATSS